MSDNAELKLSPLSRTIEQDGKKLRVEICEDGDGAWLLEVFDEFNNWAKDEGAKGLGYIVLEKNKEKLAGKGPIGKFFSKNSIEDLAKICNLKENDAVFFSCDKEKNVEKICGLARQRLGKKLDLIDNKKFEFCWIIDFPMYQFNEDEKKIDFHQK